MPLIWTAPTYSGGCAITSYAILRNVGPSDPDNFFEIHSAEVANQPSIRSFTVTDLSGTTLGEPIRFKLEVTNRGNYQTTESGYLQVVISDVPTTPTTGPHSDTSVTSTDIIRVLYDEPFDGGSILVTYEV